MGLGDYADEKALALTFRFALRFQTDRDWLTG